MQFESIDIIGATGAVGRELIAILAERNVPSGSVRAIASDRSEGFSLPYGAGALVVEALDLDSYQPAGLVLLACNAELSRRVSSRASGIARLVIDGSSAFRSHPNVPLVIPELLDDVEIAKVLAAPLVASPNCSATQLALVLKPLDLTFGLDDVHVTTYQAVSGAGQAAIRELETQLEDEASGVPPKAVIFPHPIAGNVFPHESETDEETGWSGEELKLRSESRRLLGSPELSVAATCARVPVLRAHTQAIHVRLRKAAALTDVSAALARAPGLSLVSDGPTPRQATGGDRVLVGRVRSLSGKASEPSEQLALMTACDQLRKGAALNMMQIADLHHR